MCSKSLSLPFKATSRRKEDVFVPCRSNNSPACLVYRAVKKLAMGQTNRNSFDLWVLPHVLERKQELDELNADLPDGKKLTESQETIVKSKLLPRLTNERLFVLIRKLNEILACCSRALEDCVRYEALAD